MPDVKLKDTDPFKPSPKLLIVLGSIAVHAEEYLSWQGHPVDRIAILDLLNDPELKVWREQMDRLAFLPVKR